MVRLAFNVVVPREAERMAEIVVAVAPVLIWTVAELCPPETTTEVGIETAVLFDESLTVVPDGGAIPLSVTVPTTELPPAVVLGDTVKPIREGAEIVKTADWVVPDKLAEIVEVVVVNCAAVAMLKVALVAPAAMVTLVGVVAPTVAVKLTDTPPSGAGRARVTVPVDELPPSTVVGDTVKPARSGVRIVSVALELVPFNVAVIVTGRVLVTAVVPTVNVPVVAPARIVTVAGTVALLEPDLRLTESPPVGAGLLRVNVPIDDEPPVTVVGERLRPVTVTGLIVNVVDFNTWLNVALILAWVVCETFPVVILKVPEVEPAGI